VPSPSDSAIGPGAEGRARLLRPAAELIAISFVALFQELTLIRWLATEVRVLAYFPNLVLISAFLGLGIGSLAAARRSLLWLWPVGIVSLAAAACAMGRVAFTQESETEHLWLLYYDLPKSAPVFHGVRLPIVALFVLTAITFIPLGQQVAARLKTFRAHSKPLWGYSFDISGSLLGVIGFAIVCFLQTTPTVWFLVMLGIAAVWFLPLRWLRWLYLIGAAATLLLVHRAERAACYSPYYALDYRIDRSTSEMEVLANGALHQIALPMQRSAPSKSRFAAIAREGYHLPYRLLGRPPRKALVLGAGTGNDVSTLLDEGAAQVDAVEIDPVILELGRSHHPDGPYASPRVRTFNTDARYFLDRSTEKYDVIVFGTLDSMTRLSALTNVRLDNFVYTAECISAARDHLTPDGGMIMYFMVSTEFIHEHISAILARAFGQPPITVEQYYNLFNHIYLSGPAFSRIQPSDTAEVNKLQAILRDATVPTDDWPYLYLEEPGLSAFYLSLMAILAGIAVLGVGLSTGWLLRGPSQWKRMDLEMFLFGLAFLLMESKCVTQINLVWGATWLASAVVFASVLAMILLSTLLCQWRPVSVRVAFVPLIATLVLNYLVPTHWLLGGPPFARLGLSVLFVGAPIFFASTCFALRFGGRAEVELAFGWNLLGAVFGGLLEFFAMMIGLKAFSLVAALAYMGAFMLFVRSEERIAGSNR